MHLTLPSRLSRAERILRRLDETREGPVEGVYKIGRITPGTIFCASLPEVVTS